MQSISIIVPVYKAEKQLARCVGSILNQTYKEFELILVDDGSPDNCGKICDDYAREDRRIKVVHKKNGGVGSARNAGMDAANGDYYVFVDSDDWIDSEYLYDLLPLINKGYDCVISEYYIDYTTENNTVFMKNTTEKEFCGKEKVKDLVTELDTTEMFETIWNKVYRAELIKQHGIRFDETMRSGEDKCFNAQFFGNAVNFYVTKFFSYHYMREGGVQTLTNKFDRSMYANSYKAMVMRKELYEKIGMTEKVHKELFARLFMKTMSYCVHNMYREESDYRFRERVEFFRLLISDDLVRECALMRDNFAGLVKLLSTLIRTGNPVFAETTYSILFFAKKRFKKIFQKFGKGSW